MLPNIEFLNHASVLVSNEQVSLLSDPWYQGDAFHKGWNLIHEFSDDEIINLLGRVTHIWISHEHPDHFSISFF
jgi:L-ascorbate metabolism protein UlaG (beta-lactamase superfamily)